MATERTLVCDRCGGRRNVERFVIEMSADAAWPIDLCNPCRLEMVGEISAITGIDRTTARIARAERAALAGEAPYKAAAGVSLPDARLWAQSHGIPVSGRGRIRGEVLELYKTCQERGDRYLQTKEARRIIASLA